MVLSPAPTAKPKDDVPASRTLAYEQAIAKPRADEQDADAKPDESADASETEDIPAFETVTSATPDGVVDPARDVASLSDESADTQDATGEGADPSQDVAAAPGANPSPYDAVPPLPGEAAPGQDEWGTDGAEQWDDERGEAWNDGQPPGDPYGPPGDPYGDPNAQDDPYGPPQADQWGGQDSAQWGDENAEQWVQVIISGSAMRSTAAEDAPMLFAFPYGRNLKVVSRYEGWVEVTDPQSSATGWMQAHTLAPSRPPGEPYGQAEAYYDDQPRPGAWLRRNADGFADMINRAFGGAF